MIRVGITIPAINLWNSYTKPAIDSVFEAMEEAKKRDIDCTLFFLDNGSDDETQVEAAKLKFLREVKEDFIYGRNDERKGFQASVNEGADYFFTLGYDYVLTLNNDIILHPAAIWRLVERFQKGNVGMVTCMDVRAEIDENELDPHNLRTLSDVLKVEVPEAPHPHFSAFMVSKECWETVGEMDEVFFPAYYEDNDYHHRMKILGVNAVLYPPAMFYHYGSRTQYEAIGRRFTDSHNQHMMYIRKWGADPGVERFDYPYNDPKFSLRSTKQNPSA